MASQLLAWPLSLHFPGLLLWNHSCRQYWWKCHPGVHATQTQTFWIKLHLFKWKCWTLRKSSEGEGSPSRGGQVVRPRDSPPCSPVCYSAVRALQGLRLSLQYTCEREHDNLLLCGVSAFQTQWLCAPWPRGKNKHLTCESSISTCLRFFISTGCKAPDMT